MVRLTSPTVEPVTLTEAKEQLKVDFDQDDLIIVSMISTARAKAERYCNRFFADGTARVMFDTFPVGDLPLNVPVPDVATYDAVNYIDEDNTTQAVASFTGNTDFQLVWPASGETWPTGTQGASIDVTVAAPVEMSGIKQAVLLLITDFYEYRGQLTERQVFDNQAAFMLLQPYRESMGI